jgi:hypothetical protein
VSADPALWRALDATSVRLVGVRPAREVCAAVGRRHYLHPGPPLEGPPEAWPGPIRSAVVGALLFEQEVGTADEAEAEIRRGAVELSPCHHAGGVTAMAGVVTPRLPVVVVETGGGRRAFSPLNEGPGRGLRFGMNDAVTLGRLDWLARVLAPCLDTAIAATEPVDLVALQAEALTRGDECHNRSAAASAALVVRLAPAIARTSPSPDAAAAVLADLAANGQFFLSFSMATAKAVMDEVHALGRGGVVTAICSNGRDTGVRVSGCGDRWFTAPASIGAPVLRAGFTRDDVNPTVGDSPIVETSGLGALALAAAPALCEAIGVEVAALPEHTRAMRGITLGASSRYRLAVDGGRGTPLGIDVSAVRATGVGPTFTNGLVHRRPAGGPVGVAFIRTPIEPLIEAARAIGAPDRTPKG